jgi:hypothetical protein
VYDLILDGGTARETSTFTVVRDSGFANKAKQLDLVLKQGANVCATTN